MTTYMGLAIPVSDDVFGGVYFCAAFPTCCRGWDLGLQLDLKYGTH